MGRAGTTAPPRSCSKVEVGSTNSCTASGSPHRKCDDQNAGGIVLTKRQQPKDSWQQRWPSDVLRTMQVQLALLQPHELEQCKTKRKNCNEEVSVKANATVELPEQPALPYQWEQFLDLETGEVYYIDWSSCKRTCRDPRELLQVANKQIKSQLEAVLESPANQQTPAISPQNITQKSWNQFSSKTSNSVLQKLSMDTMDEDVMVARGCCQCLMYFMLPKLAPECPSCGGLLQHSASPPSC
ncbi:hypothetical protein O6H91_19G052800 [Diphasiastrum complanatum]|uniref:Uncharacterized protein n=2 Tax=Diphasiastrum complanatum TaxID=34168 RepID=A0ACC2AV44_DIPCM|nr:hypothetical protein O6H91_19G052800 [Diphasiastrum complanatum]KAJ7521412.1 hypothetical protein O6H91_19G052800 [Diphasiastrum complanatum]